MARSKTSNQWLKEHFSDPYVIQAKKQGYRSRAVYKLIELQESNQLFTRGDTVLDIGAAPGSWSQYVAKEVGHSGRVLSLDLLEFDNIPGVDSLVGDFTDEHIYTKLIQMLDGKYADCVLSDMLPNSTGIKLVDQLKAESLLEATIDFSLQVLKKDSGKLVAKALQGPGFADIVRKLREKFTKVKIKKPKASRARSQEVYLLALGYR